MREPGDATAEKESARAASVRRLRLAKEFIEQVEFQSLGKPEVFGTTVIEIRWRKGEVEEVVVNPGRTYK